MFIQSSHFLPLPFLAVIYRLSTQSFSFQIKIQFFHLLLGHSSSPINFLDPSFSWRGCTVPLHLFSESSLTFPFRYLYVLSFHCWSYLFSSHLVSISAFSFLLHPFFLPRVFFISHVSAHMSSQVWSLSYIPFLSLSHGSSCRTTHPRPALLFLFFSFFLYSVGYFSIHFPIHWNMRAQIFQLFYYYLISFPALFRSCSVIISIAAAFFYDFFASQPDITHHHHHHLP